MSRTRILCSAALVSAFGLGLVVVPSAGAASTLCTTASPRPIVGPVTVPTGAVCGLNANDRPTDVTVNPGAKLSTQPGTRLDSLLAYGQVVLWNTTVAHSTVLTDIPVSAGASSICGSTLGGAGLALVRDAAPVDVKPTPFCLGSTAVSGNVKLIDNPGTITLDGVSVVDYCFGRGNARVVVRALTTLDGERRGDCSVR